MDNKDQKYLTKDQAKNLLDNAPQGISKEAVVKRLVDRGYVIQGLNDEGYDGSNPPQDKTKVPEDSMLSRGVKAVKEGFSNLKDSFQKRADSLKDTTLKTGEDYAQQVKPEDITRAFKGELSNNPAVDQLLAPTKNALNFVGQVAGGAFDILGEGLKVAYKTATPEEKQKKIAEGIHGLLQTDLGQAGLQKIGEGAQAYEEWKKAHPDGAQAIENVLNVSGLFGGKAAEEVAAPLVKEGKDLLVQKSKEGLETAAKLADKTYNKLDEASKARKLAEVQNKAYESVTPKTTELTPKEYEDLLAQKKITPRTATQEPQYILSENEKKIAEKYAPLLQSKDPVENSVKVMQEITKKDKEVGQFLTKNNGAFNSGELRNYLTKKMEDITDINVDDARLAAKKEQMINNFINGLPKKNMVNLWQNRKQFDAYIEKAFSGSPSLQKELKKGLRNGVQDFIADRTPDGVYKQAMKDMRELFDVEDVVATRAAKERGESGISNWFKTHPKTTKTLQIGAGTAGVGTLWSYVSQ